MNGPVNEASIILKGKAIWASSDDDGFVPSFLMAQQPLDSVNYELTHDLIFIKLRINDHSKELNFLWDTGAGISVIDEGIAKELDLVASDSIKVGTSGKTLLSKLTTQASIKLGSGTTITGTELAWMDLSHLSKYLYTQVDGVIGSDLLHNFVVETNHRDKKLKFYDPTDFQYTGQGTVVDLMGLESGHIGIPAQVVFEKGGNAQELVLKVDTAAPNAITLHNQSAVKYDLLSNEKNLRKTEGFGADPTVTTNLRTKAHRVALMGKVWKRVPVVLEVDPLNRESERKADGLIGQSLLLDFIITYDLSRKTAYFETY
jgi:hypothetical protein